MKHLKSKLFSLLTLLCLLLSACGNDAAKPDAEAPTEIDTTSQEAETTEPFIKVTIFENPSEEADEETSAATRVCHFIQYIIIKFFLILQGFPCFFNTHMI